MVATVELRCVLRHWYELRRPGDDFGSGNNKRLVDIKALHMVLRRQGLDALRGQITAGVNGQRITDPALLLVGAGLFPDNLVVETFVRRALHAQRSDYRSAATYASLFFLNRSEEAASILTERVVLGQEDVLVVAASCDALAIWDDIQSGGKCRRCVFTRGNELHDLDWVPAKLVRTTRFT